MEVKQAEKPVAKPTPKLEKKPVKEEVKKEEPAKVVPPPAKVAPAKKAKEEKKQAPKVIWDAKDTEALANTKDPVEAERLVLKYFASIDVDNSGFIEKDEMITVVKSLYEIEISKRPEFKDALIRKDPKIIEAIKIETEKIALDTIKKMDLDKDGRVSKEEMVKSIVLSK